ILLREDGPVWTCLFPYILIGFSASPRPGRAGARQQYRTYCAQRRAGSQARDFDLVIRPADWSAYGWNQGAYLDKLPLWDGGENAWTNLPPAPVRVRHRACAPPCPG